MNGPYRPVERAFVMTVTRVSEAMVTCPKTHDHGSTVDEIRAFFEDDHVQMALIVAPDGRLSTTIERQDVDAAAAGSTSAKELGTLAGRTVGPSEPLAAATATLLRQGRRRLAVVARSGRLLGLLCLKRDGTGYCSDEGVDERARDRAAG
jgi:signal-transduction protein with cAMP-binding, CBS, and nucleotidyltransferase domain